ncbi:hypothetical protein ACC684_28560 [Rhizobium ruizarguesonis]
MNKLAPVEKAAAANQAVLNIHQIATALADAQAFATSGEGNEKLAALLAEIKPEMLDGIAKLSEGLTQVAAIMHGADPFKLNAKSAAYVKEFYLSAAAHIEAGTAADYAPTARTARTWATWPQKVEWDVKLFREWAAMLDRYEYSNEEISEDEMLEQALIVIHDLSRNGKAQGDTRPVTCDMESLIHARLDEIEAERVARKHRLRGHAEFFAGDFIWDRPQKRVDEFHARHINERKFDLPERRS